MPPVSRWLSVLCVSGVPLLTGCDLDYPEVAVVNRTQDPILLKNPSFGGCVWNTVLANGAATSPGRCLPGDDHVHFQKLDAAEYCAEQAADGTLPGVCPCDGGVEASRDGGIQEGLVNAVPTWFNYQTVSVRHASYGQFYLFEITLDDMEQDFSVPGPYGH
jgi:hypothetical protein